MTQAFKKWKGRLNSMKNLTELTIVKKEQLLEELDQRIDWGHEVLCVPKFKNNLEFDKFGFAAYQSMSYDDFDLNIYASEATAHLFHDAYSFNSIEFIKSLVEEENWDVLYTIVRMFEMY